MAEINPLEDDGRVVGPLGRKGGRCIWEGFTIPYDLPPPLDSASLASVAVRSSEISSYNSTHASKRNPSLHCAYLTSTTNSALTTLQVFGRSS
jgi:hypothetical protein